MEEVYRQCAAAAVFRPSDVCDVIVYQLLLVHKPRKNDAWQLPQGGREGDESLTEAALRELQEEAGVTGKVVGKSSETYQYDFPASYRKARPDHVKGQQVQFLFVLADPSTAVTVDCDEIDAYTWVVPEQFSSYVEREEYCLLLERLYEEGISKLAEL